MDFLDVHQTRYLLQWWSPTKLRFFSRIWSDVSRAKKTLPICANPLSMIAALGRTRVETQHPLTGEGCYGNRKRKPALRNQKTRRGFVFRSSTKGYGTGTPRGPDPRDTQAAAGTGKSPSRPGLPSGSLQQIQTRSRRVA